MTAPQTPATGQPRDRPTATERGAAEDTRPLSAQRLSETSTAQSRAGASRPERFDLDRWLDESRAEQGLSPVIDDEATLRRIARLIVQAETKTP